MILYFISVFITPQCRRSCWYSSCYMFTNNNCPHYLLISHRDILPFNTMALRGYRLEAGRYYSCMSRNYRQKQGGKHPCRGYGLTTGVSGVSEPEEIAAVSAELPPSLPSLGGSPVSCVWAGEGVVASWPFDSEEQSNFISRTTAARSASSASKKSSKRSMGPSRGSGREKG